LRENTTMTTSRWIAGVLVVLASVSGAALGLQRREAEVLRGQIALLREERGEWQQMGEENRRRAAEQVVPEELARLPADHAAVVRLRGEIERLRESVQAREREVAARVKGRE